MQKNVPGQGAGDAVRLSVVAYAYPFAERAFTKFCVNYIDTAHSLKCRLRRIGMVSQGMEYLKRDEADVRS